MFPMAWCLLFWLFFPAHGPSNTLRSGGRQPRSNQRSRITDFNKDRRIRRLQNGHQPMTAYFYLFIYFFLPILPCINRPEFTYGHYARLRQLTYLRRHTPICTYMHVRRGSRANTTAKARLLRSSFVITAKTYLKCDETYQELRTSCAQDKTRQDKKLPFPLPGMPGKTLDTILPPPPAKKSYTRTETSFLFSGFLLLLLLHTVCCSLELCVRLRRQVYPQLATLDRQPHFRGSFGAKIPGFYHSRIF